jgi:hypothetical protein
LTAALARCAASSVSQETQRSADRDGRQQQERRAEFGNRQFMLEGTDHHFGDEHRLGDDQPGTHNSQTDDRHQEQPGGAGVSQQSRVDRFHVKHTLGSSRCVSRETHPLLIGHVSRETCPWSLGLI